MLLHGPIPWNNSSGRLTSATVVCPPSKLRQISVKLWPKVYWWILRGIFIVAIACKGNSRQHFFYIRVKREKQHKLWSWALNNNYCLSITNNLKFGAALIELACMRGLTVFLTFRCIKSVFRPFFRYIPRRALIVYRLIDSALIGNFSMIPSYFKIEIFAKCFSCTTLCSKG